VEWLEGGRPGTGGKPKVDYREVLSPEDFALFSKLREKRRELAQRDGVQVYTIMTNEQLAEMVRLKVNDLAGLRKIDGIGEARIEKYGEDMLSVIGAHEQPAD
jgi:superfamily II DNA helicase RecQ